jgi:hypothetical protein
MAGRGLERAQERAAHELAAPEAARGSDLLDASVGLLQFSSRRFQSEPLEVAGRRRS